MADFQLVDFEDGDDADSFPPSVDEDICRVCRAGPSAGRPLFHPCMCTGSIKFVHQDCLVRWLKHSGKQYCELCKHQFEFTPIYRPDMPHRLPLIEVLAGLTRGTVSNVRHWLHLSFVVFMWLVIVPICISRIYKFLLYGSLWSIARFPLDLVSLENVIIDEVYGLIIVFVSLIGFISLVWLKDQLGNGGAPQWLANDHRAVNRLHIQEAQDRVNVLRQHLEAAGERARERQNAPERLAVSQELLHLHEQLHKQLKILEVIQHDKFVERLDQLRIREMEITYDLGMSQWRYQLLLKSAREKKTTGLEDWKGKRNSERMEMQRRVAEDPSMEPPHWPTVDEQVPPSEVDLGLTLDERAILRVHSRAPLELGEEERAELKRKLQDLREEQKVLGDRNQQHQNTICKLLGNRGEDDGEVEEVSPAEWSAILSIRELKKEIKETTGREQAIIQQQNREEEERRHQAEDRMNRWYNRLLGRHQDDPLVLARRRRNRPQRPNIGQALAGLARDQPDQVNAAGGENVEELTWARLLGLDGSFRFLEHVMWLICLNSALIIGFVYLPYQIGWFIAAAFSLWDWLGIVTWRGVLSIFVGYLLAAGSIMVFYYSTGLMKLPSVYAVNWSWEGLGTRLCVGFRSILGVTYVSIKVGLILAVEAGFFPLMCGWWIDICAFSLFGSTLKSRQASLESAPGTVMFLHWLAGMIFIFYLASFVMLLREVLRPGVLWFLRNLNDQNFHPIHEMITLPFHRHLRRFIMSCLMFGVCVMVILLLPSKVITTVFKGFLPFNLSLTSSMSPIREVQLELVLLQFVIPTLLEHGNCRTAFKFIIQHWANSAASFFGLHSYLLDKPQTGGNLVDLHENVLREVPYDRHHEGPIYDGPLEILGPGFAPFKPYLRPPFFHLRVLGLLTYAALTTIILSTFFLLAPVSLGRFLMSLVGMARVPEIYTAAIGLYGLWLIIRLASAVIHYISLGIKTFADQIQIWMIQSLKCVVAGFLLFIVIPLLLGHLVDLLLITPLRVPADRTPIFYPSTEWALGLLHTKCMCGAIWLTNIGFKRTLDQMYQAGVRNLNLTFITKEVAWPVILILSLCIAIPYITFMGLFPLLGVLSYQNCLLVYRFFFPFVLSLLLCFTVLIFSVKQASRLYNHVRNEKYLVGRQLVNYSTPQPAEDVNYVTAVQETGEQ